jgi:hypothetical protein
LLALVIVTINIISGLCIAKDSQFNAINVIKELDRNGERAFISQLYVDADLFRSLILNIENASADWISIAVRLIHHCRESFCSEMESANLVALSKKPRSILSSLHEESESESICSAPFLIDYPEIEKGLETLKRTERLPKQVESEEMKGKKNLCRKELEMQISKVQSSLLQAPQLYPRIQ